MFDLNNFSMLIVNQQDHLIDEMLVYMPFRYLVIGVCTFSLVQK